MLRDIYLESGWWSVLAWVGTVMAAGVVAVVIVAVRETRVPRIKRGRRG